MKVDKKNVTLLAEAVREVTKSQEIEGSDLVAYYLDDITLLFSHKQKGASFYGLVIDVLNRSFHIVSDLKVMIEDTLEEDEEPVVYEIEDENVIAFLNKFLVSRAELIKALGA